MAELMQEPLRAGGEVLLFVLFVLFSVGSALLERRKRKQQAEAARNAPPAPAGSLTDEEEEEETGGWPFPMGGDPFDLPKPKQQPARRPAPAAEPEPTVAAASGPRRTLIEQMELDAKRLQEPDAGDGGTGPLQETERRALLAELRARGVGAGEGGERTDDRKAQEVQSRRKMEELVRERVERDEGSRPRSKKRPKWLLTPQTARDAVIFTEILGKPKSEREGEDIR